MLELRDFPQAEIMDIGKSFSYQFEDKQWITKLGLGALISLVPILNVALTGYMVGIIRNVTADAREPLPNWDNLGQQFRDGLILAAASLVYAAPLLIVVCLPLGFLALPGVVSQYNNWQEVGRSIAGAGGVLFACLFCLFSLYILLFSIIHPVIFVIFSREGTFASCFKLTEIFRILSLNARPFFTIWLVTIIGSFAVGLLVAFANLVLGLIPCLGWIASLLLGLSSAMYIITLDAHLFGQFRVVAFGQPALTLTPTAP